MTPLIRYTAAALVGGFSFLGGQALTVAAETQSPVQPAPLAPPPPTVREVPSESTPPQQELSPEATPNAPSVSQTPPVTCPPGQFPSAFPDVLPTDWAYEAVSQLASVPIRCFPLPGPLVR